MEKIVIITLLFLTWDGEIKQQSFEIPSKESCESWFHHNVKVIEPKKRKLFSSHTYHLYKDKQVIGYVCNDKPPQ